MDFEKRLAAVFVGGTGLFIYAAEMMKYDGYADSRNPSWILISTIRNLFLLGWLVALVVFLAGVAYSVKEEREKALEAKRIEEERRKEAIARELRWIEGEKDRLRKLEKELNERETERQATLAAAWRELEERKTRSTEEAVDQALEDFV